MAETIRGIHVQIGSDTTGLSKALSDVNKNAKNIAGELRQVEKLLKFNPKNTELIAQKQKLLGAQVANTRDKLNRLKVAQEQVNEQFKKGEITEGQYRAFQRELVKTESQLKNFETQLKNTTSRSDQFAKKMQEAGNRLKNVGTKMSNIGKSLSIKLTAPILAAGGAVIKTSADFQKAMNESTSIMNDLADTMKNKMSVAAREVAKTTRFSARESAKAYFFLASAGLDAAKSIGALPRVAAFAQAGNFDLALATDLLTDAQSALGLAVKDATQNITNMNRVSDVLVKANTLANANVQQFSEALTNKAGPALRLLKKDVEEGAAVLAVYADQGIKGVRAGDSLNIVLRDLQKAAIKNKEEFKKANIAVFDSSGNMRNMADIVQDLEGRLSGMSDEQVRTELTMLGFQDKSISAMQALVGTSEAIRNYEKQLRDAGGTTDEIAEKQLQNFWDQMGLLKDRLLDVAITLGDELLPIINDHLKPAFEGMISNIETAVNWFKELSPEMQKTILVISGLAAVAGPVLIVAGSITTAIGTLLPLVGTLGIKIGLIKAPVIGTVAAIAALAAGAILVYRNWDEAKRALLSVWDLIKASAVQLQLNMSIIFEKMKVSVLGVIDSILEKLGALENLPFGIGEKFQGLKENISNSSQESADKLKYLEAVAKENGKNMSTALEGTKAAFSDFGTAVTEDVNKVIALFKGETEALEEEKEKQIKEEEESSKTKVKIDKNMYIQYGEQRTEDKKKHEEYLNKKKQFEESWTDRLFEQSASRIEKLEVEKQAAIAKAKAEAKELKMTEESLQIVLTDIELYYANERQKINKEEEEKILNLKKDYLSRWERAVFEQTATELQLLEQKEKDELDLLKQKAKELELSEEEIEIARTKIKEFYSNERVKLEENEKEAVFDLQEALEEKNRKMEIATAKNKVYGDSYDLIGQKISILTETMNTMIENGIDPSSEEIQVFKNELDVLKESIGDVDTQWATFTTTVQNSLETQLAAIIDGTSKAGNVFQAFGLVVQDVYKGLAKSIAESLAENIMDQNQWVGKTLSNIAKTVVAYIQQAYASLVAFFSWMGPFAPAAAGGVIAGAMVALGKLAQKAFELVGLEEGGLVTGPTAALIGEGKDKEAVLPLNQKVLSELGRSIAGNMPQQQVAYGRPVKVDLHIGTLVADKLGLKQLERQLQGIRISENMRLEVSKA